MKKLCLAFFVLITFSCVSSQAWAVEVKIVRSPQASKLEKLGAEELVRYIYLRTGELLSAEAGEELSGGSAIVVARKDRPIVMGNKNIAMMAKGLGPQEYILKTVGKKRDRVVWIVGGDDVGALYGAYHFLEKLGVRFYLHGDVVPDKNVKLALPEMDEKGSPLFELRGLNPWGAHAEGIDTWDADKYKAVFAQMAKMRMNMMFIHAYPEHSGLGTEPAVWVGLGEDVDEDGNVLFSSETSYWNTARTPWGYKGKKTGDYSFGGSLLFESDHWGADVLGGQFPAAMELNGRNEVFNRTGAMFNDSFTFARELGIKTALGCDTGIFSPWKIENELKPGEKLSVAEHGPSWIIPEAVRERIKAQGRDPKDPAVLQEIYEGIFTRIARAHPLDYFVLFTQEQWYWHDFSKQMFDMIVEEWKIALKAWEKVSPEFGMGVSGWVLGPDFDHAAFDKVLPKHVAISELSRAYDAPVDEGFGRMQGRQKWAVPWIEEDSPMLTPSFWAGRIRKDAADALAYGCTGFMTLHWRTRIVGPCASASAMACWDQSGWNPEFGKDKPGVPDSTFAIDDLSEFEGPIDGTPVDYPNYAVAGTEEDRLYQTHRFNMKGYRLKVPNGKYKVTLKFCDTLDYEGGRVFDVTLQDKLVLDKLDIFARVGRGVVLDFSFDDIKVGNGWLDIGFVPHKQFPLIMAFEVAGDEYNVKVNCGGGNYKDYISDRSFYRPTRTFMWGEKGSQFKARGLDVDDFYADWAKGMFGDEVADKAGKFFARLDGRIPLIANWVGANGGGAGGLAPDERRWEEVSKEYAFVDEFEKLRRKVRGAGSLERFDYWLNNFRYTRAAAKAECSWGQLEIALNKVRSEEDIEKKKTIAKEKVLPIYAELVSQIGDAYRLQMATITTLGGMQTILNWEGHNNLLGIDKSGKELAEMLGEKLPPEVIPTKKYHGEPKLIVQTVRSLLDKGESLKLKVIVLDNELPKTAALYWRPLGKGNFHKLNLKHVSRAVHSVTLPAVDQTIEYYIKAETSVGKKLVWPASAEKINQTVVVID